MKEVGPVALDPPISLLSDMEEVDDNQLVLAATEVENQNVSSVSKTAVVKKNSPKIPLSTFNGYTFGSIGTLNIHIHKD